MRSKKRMWLMGFCLLAPSLLLPPASALAQTVSVSPSSASVEVGSTAQFTATATNNSGVNWSVIYGYEKCFFNRCSGALFISCGNGCGTVSPTSIASGAPTTYRAPAQFKPPFIYCGPWPNRCPAIGVFVRATSVTNSSAFGQASITFPPISVAMSPTSTSVAVNGTYPFTATVTNDGTNSGVTWTLTQNGVACSPGCGTLSVTTTLSGALTIYMGPTSVPSLPLVTLSATSVDDKTKSATATIAITTSSGAVCTDTGSEALLKGQYAFLLQGTDFADIVAIAGSFSADGTGKVTGGEIDFIHSYVGGQLSDVAINATGSGYSVGTDHRGCLMLANANGWTMFFRFAVGSINSSNIATKGHMIEFDDTTGNTTTNGTRAAGTLRLQDRTSFSASKFKGDYVFGLAGSGTSSAYGRGAMAGAISSDGLATITGGSFDFNDGRTFTSNIAFTPSTPFRCCSANGRGTIGTGTLQDNGGAWVFNLAMYMINSNDAFLIGGVIFNPNNNCCSATLALGTASGEAFAAPGPFSSASLNGASVVHEMAQSASLDQSFGRPMVDIATASSNGTGAMTVNDNVNAAGTFSTSSTAFNYVVASNGRVALTGSSTPPVIYLYGQNQGIVLGTDLNVQFGTMEPQAPGPFSDSSFSGEYMFGTEGACPACVYTTFESGVATGDGKGNASGTSDQSGPAGLAENQSLKITYSISANGTGNVGSDTTAILISGNKLVFINNTSTNPTITVAEK
jgi:hypothetical protein